MLLMKLWLTFRLFLLNKLKVSYSCSIEKIIVNHNRKIMERSNKEFGRCNCRVKKRKKKECPLNRACLTRNAVYEAKAINGGETKN